jgi:hypothetical protein
MKTGRKRTLELREPDRPAKEFCKRGHPLAVVGYYLNAVGPYTVRRCRMCANEDVYKCTGRERSRHSKLLDTLTAGE